MVLWLFLKNTLCPFSDNLRISSNKNRKPVNCLTPQLVRSCQPTYFFCYYIISKKDNEAHNNLIAKTRGVNIIMTSFCGTVARAQSTLIIACSDV